MDATFIKLIREISWDSLTNAQAQEVMSALRGAVTQGEKWFANFAESFGRPAAPLVITTETTRQMLAGSVLPAIKRKRGRPPKARPTAHPPLTLGGSENQPEPKPAALFQNSYVSKEGPRGDVPAVLPPNHPRRGGQPTSVTPQDDAADFQIAERVIAKGGKPSDIFN